MTQTCIALLMAAIGSFGFSLLFQLRGYKLLITAAGGAFNWLMYLLAFSQNNDRVMSFFIASLATVALAEVCARVLKMPGLTLTVPMLIPLIPGGDLYYTTLALVQGETEDFAYYGSLLIREATAMALGMILVTCILYTGIRSISLLKHIYKKKHCRKR